MTVMVVDQSAPLASLHSALRKTLATMQQQQILSRQARMCAACRPKAAPPQPSPILISPPLAGTPCLPAPHLSSLQPRWQTLKAQRQAGAGAQCRASCCRWRRGTGRWRGRCRCSHPAGWCPAKESVASKPVQIAR